MTSPHSPPLSTSAALDTTRDQAEEPRSGPRNGRWQIPGGGGRTAAAHARRALHDALERWGLGQAAGDVVSLVNQLVSNAAMRGHGPLDLRLELRESARLLLGEIRAAVPSARETHDQISPFGDAGVACIALAVTYGRRAGRDGADVWYTHAFTWTRLAGAGLRTGEV